MEKQSPMGRVLPFARTAKEVRHLAAKKQEHGELLKALDLLRVSRDKSPSDPDTLMAMADVYASMRCFALSTRVYSALTEDEAYSAGAFFGMGENFYAQQFFGVAHDCLVMALQKAPEAAFVPDAIDLLDAIDEMRQTPALPDLRVQRRMERVLSAMDRERVSLAVRQIRRVLSLDGRSASIQSLQAFAMLAAGDAEGALAAARRAWRADKNDIRALCAMASALKLNHSMPAAHAFLIKAAAQIEQEDDTQLVCQTACEMGEHAFIVDLLLPYESRLPYSDTLLHPLACALHNMGNTSEAIRRWRLLRRINPMDSVSEYRLRMAEAGTLPEEISYAVEVPLSEILTRLGTLREWMQEPAGNVARRWREEESLEMLLRWGLQCKEAGIAQAACGILRSIGDARARQALREVLCDPAAPASLKETALASLFTPKAPGPYYAIMDDRLTLVHVSRAKDDPADRQQQTQALTRRVQKLLDDHPGDAQAIHALCQKALDIPTNLKNDSIARAVVCAYCRQQGHPSPLATTYRGHRKVGRFANKILKETQHADH